MDNLYDICIIGAGPSGSYAAYLLAKSGYKILLIDKSKFPRDKCCGGFLSSRAQKYLKPWISDIPIQNTISSIELYSQNMESIKWESSDLLGSTIMRKEFDYYIVKEAVKQGVQFYDGVLIYKIIEKDDEIEVDTSMGAFVSKFLIGADGVFSFTAKCLGLTNRYPLYKMGYTCSQIINMDSETIDRSTVELYCIPFLGGFGWCFPTKMGINIGVGASTYGYKRLHKYYYEFVNRVFCNKKLSILSVPPKGAFIPAGGFSRTLCKGKTLLIGDAAGGVDPFSGEGLEHAFASAALAVESIKVESFQHPYRICRIYNEKYKKEIMHECHISLLMAIASWKKGNLFFNLFKHSNSYMKIFETIMTHNSPYSHITKKGLFNLTPWNRLNK